MGTLFYDGYQYAFPDRTLGHLQVVISAKLRRGEGFFLAWPLLDSDGGGRHVLWLDKGVPIQFRYQDGSPPQIDRAWAESLVRAANSNGGLIIADDTITGADV